MADACTLDTGAEIITELALVGGGEFTPKEGSDVVCFNGVYRGADNGVVNWLEFSLLWRI